MTTSKWSGSRCVELARCSVWIEAKTWSKRAGRRPSTQSSPKGEHVEVDVDYLLRFPLDEPLAELWRPGEFLNRASWVRIPPGAQVRGPCSPGGHEKSAAHQVSLRCMEPRHESSIDAETGVLGTDIRDVPNYPAAEAARCLGMVTQTLRTWFLGQKAMQPLFTPADTKPLTLSFWNLVESSVVASIRKVHGISFQKVRRALRFVEQQMGLPRPLITQDFATDGVSLFVEHYGALISATEDGQVVIRELIEASLTRIERDEEGLAAKLYAWTHDPHEPKVVSIDPRVSFGRPTLAGTGVTVEALVDRFHAGDTIAGLAEDYRVSPDKVEAMMRWVVSGASAA